jgi:hypothetical protein
MATIEQKKSEMVKDLINKMFEIAGHDVTYDDVKDRKDDWYTQWTMTVKQSNEWVEWGEKEIARRFRRSKKLCQVEMAWFSLMYGLKFRISIDCDRCGSVIKTEDQMSQFEKDAYLGRQEMLPKLCTKCRNSDN